MKAGDTVASWERIRIVSAKCRKKGIEGMFATEAQRKDQAELSFKAGIKLVVEFIEGKNLATRGLVINVPEKEWHKGDQCLYRDEPLFCQEGFCDRCAVKDKWLASQQRENGKKKESLWDFLGLEERLDKQVLNRR